MYNIITFVLKNYIHPYVIVVLPIPRRAGTGEPTIYSGGFGLIMIIKLAALLLTPDLINKFKRTKL